MALTKEELLRRLEVLRRAENWSDDEFEKRKNTLFARHDIGGQAAQVARIPAPVASRPKPTGQRRKLDRSEYRAPYVFIEIEDAVAKPPDSVLNVINDKLLSHPLPDGFCGAIELEWVAETPLLIGDAGEVDINGKMAPAVVPLRTGVGGSGDFYIPGSTFRGMIRAAAEIVGYARLDPINRNHVFALRDFDHPLYNPPAGAGYGLPIAKAGQIRAGWLHISKEIEEHNDGKPGCLKWCIEEVPFSSVEIDDLLKSGYIGKRHTSRGDWAAQTLRQKYEAAGMKPDGKINFSKTSNFSLLPPDLSGRRLMQPDANGNQEGVLVFSGKAIKSGQKGGSPDKNKKFEYVFERPPSGNNHVPLPPDVVERFELVHTRPGVNERKPIGSWAELKSQAVDGNPIPVFFTGDLARITEPEEAKMFAFGLTRLFRVSHEYSVADKINLMEAHRVEKGTRPDTDFVSALFGYVYETADDAEGEPEEALKGRIAFSGARIEETPTQTPVQDEPVIAVAMSPNESFSPFYLRGEEKDWSSDESQLAGRKAYMPRYPVQNPNNNPALADIRKRLHGQLAALTGVARSNEDVQTRLCFLREKDGRELRFNSTVRLHNVTAEEIGLVLFALTHGGDPAKPCRHLMGRARALGAGQLRLVSARLSIEANLPGTDAAQCIKAPVGYELPEEQEGFVPKEDNGVGGNASHRPFIDALIHHMRKPGTFIGTSGNKVAGEYPQTKSIRQWLGAASPQEGKNLPGASEITYLALKDHRELRRRTQMQKQKRAAEPDILLPAPEHAVFKPQQ